MEKKDWSSGFEEGRVRFMGWAESGSLEVSALLWARMAT